MIHYSLPNKDGSNKDNNRERKGFSAIDISLPTTAANVAEISLTGRYPEAGFALNKQSEMIVRILEGSTVFQCEDEEVFLPTGSTILVETNKAYCWIPEEFVKLYVVSTPPWTPEQHQNITA